MTGHDRRLARWCRRQLRELDLRPPVRLEDLRLAIERKRGRPLRIATHNLEAATFGVWFALDDRDVVLVQRHTARAHQPHIICHELAHMLLEHPSDSAAEDALEQLTPHLGDTTRRLTMQRRSCYDEKHERDAEFVATIFCEWMDRVELVLPHSTGPGGALQRLVASPPRL